MKKIMEVCKISHRHNGEEREAISDFSLDVWEGDRIAVLGYSGSGKTTTLNVLGLLEKIQQGSVVYYGEDGKAYEYASLSSEMAQRIRQRDFAFLFQDANLLHFLSGLENVAESLVLAGEDPSKALAEAEKTLFPLFFSVASSNQKEIHWLIAKTSSRLSGGQRHRMAIGRMMVRRARVFFVDEPTASLDPETAKENLHYFRNYLDETNGTAFLVSHKYEDAFALGCNRFLFLKGGKIHVFLDTQGKWRTEVPYFSGLDTSYLEKIRDWDEKTSPTPIAIPEDKIGVPFPVSALESPISPRKKSRKIDHLAWNWRLIRKDLTSARSFVFTWVVGMISFIAALAYCITTGLAGATVEGLREAIEKKPDFRKIQVLRHLEDPRARIEESEQKKLSQIAGVEGRAYKTGELSLCIHPTPRSEAHYIPARFLEKEDPQSQKLRIFYSVPDPGYCCGIVLSKKARENAKKMGSITSHRDKDGKLKEFLTIYKHGSSSRKIQEEEISVPVLSQKAPDSPAEYAVLGDETIRQAKKMGIFQECAGERYLVVSRRMMIREDSQIHDKLALPILDTVWDEETGSEWGFAMLPIEFGVFWSGDHAAAVSWHTSWATLFYRPDGEPLRKYGSILDSPVQFVCDEFSAREGQLENVVREMAIRQALENPTVAWKDDGKAIVSWDIPPGELRYAQVKDVLEKTLSDAFPGIDISAKSRVKLMEVEKPPDVSRYRACRVNLYIQNLDDVLAVIEVVRRELKLYPKYSHLGAYSVLKTIGVILRGVVMVTMALFSLFTVIAVGSASLALVERNRGEIGISRAFGNPRSRIIVHYVMSGIFTTMLFACLGMGLVKILECTVMPPILQEISENLGIQFSFALGLFDCLLAFGLPVGTTALSILIPAMYLMRFSPAELIRNRVA